MGGVNTSKMWTFIHIKVELWNLPTLYLIDAWNWSVFLEDIISIGIHMLLGAICMHEEMAR